MTTSGKKVTLGAMAKDIGEALEELLLTRPRAWVAGARERLRDLPKTNFELGSQFADEGKLFDAVFRFKVVLMLNRDYPHAWYNLGSCYFRMGKAKEAVEALREALRRDPTNIRARFMLASLAPESLSADQRPTRMPREMVEPFFAANAAQYDLREAAAGYQAGAVVYELVKPLASATPRVLDVGCGTGIVARPWRAAATEVVGVDFTPEMLAFADKATHAEKKLFDRLVEADIEALPDTLGQFDLALMVNVSQFVGEMTRLIPVMTQHLAPGGMLVMTLAPYAGSGGFGLAAATGQFGHQPAYVKALAGSSGLALIKETSLALYRDAAAQETLVFRKA